MPGDSKTLVKSSIEKMKEFNKRLRSACESAPVTSFEVAVVDGLPVVTLISETHEADEEDVADAKKFGDKIELGDVIPDDDTICVQVSGLSAVGDEAANTESVMDQLNDRAEGETLGVRFFSGQYVQWVKDENDVRKGVEKPALVMAIVPVTYAAVFFLQEPVDQDVPTKGAQAKA